MKSPISTARVSVFVADLTHTAQGIAALTFPLGAALVTSHARAACGDAFAIRLFKYPDALAQAIIDAPPQILALSNYAWNLDLGTRLAGWAKSLNPNLIVISGGPNFPVATEEKIAWLAMRPEIDFYIQNEGEVAFAALLNRLRAHGLDAGRMKEAGEIIGNCNYLCNGRLIEGPVTRIADINVIPSPYLTGVLDEFFDSPLTPLLETTRGCPFTCAFCADGLASKSRIARFDSTRTRAELRYIAERIKNVDELIITDLNFAMYKEDIHTAEYIAEIQAEFHWPLQVGASAGKNLPDRIQKVADLLNGTWIIGSAVQSTDPEVLKNIKRSNISLEAYQSLIDYTNKQSRGIASYSEVIVGLPGDTREKHFRSLRTAIESRVSTVRMYQAMLLSGTDMATPQTRDQFGLISRFRVMPGCAGFYRFGEVDLACAEIDEIIVGGDSMSFEDYVSCRVMNLLVESYLNNAMFEELFAALRSMDVATFDCLQYLLDHPELHSEKMASIIASFIDNTTLCLFDTYAAAREFVQRSENMAKYVSREFGRNELLDHRAELYLALDDMAAVLLRVVFAILAERGELTAGTRSYISELTDYILCRKKNFHQCDAPFERVFHYDFGALQANGFEFNPGCVERQDDIRFRFFTDSEQQRIIQNAVALYGRHPGGIGRMIQRSSLKKMYRQVEPA